MEKKSNTRTIVLLLYICLIIGLRAIAPLSPDFKFLANLSGIGAVAIFSGSYFKNPFLRYILPLLVLLLSDFALVATMGKDYGFYPGWYYTYIAFALMVLAGQLLIKKVNVQSVFIASAVAVLIHWIVADFGVWIGGTMYPKTLAGFYACLMAAIPFELNFIYGTLIYAILMFASFEMLKIKFPVLQYRAIV